MLLSSEVQGPAQRGCCVVSVPCGHEEYFLLKNSLIWVEVWEDARGWKTEPLCREVLPPISRTVSFCLFRLWGFVVGGFRVVWGLCLVLVLGRVPTTTAQVFLNSESPPCAWHWDPLVYVLDFKENMCQNLFPFTSLLGDWCRVNRWKRFKNSFYLNEPKYDQKLTSPLVVPPQKKKEGKKIHCGANPSTAIKRLGCRINSINY